MKDGLVNFFQNVETRPNIVILDLVKELKGTGKLDLSFDDGDLCNWGLSFRMNNWTWQRTAQEQADICMAENWK